MSNPTIESEVAHLAEELPLAKAIQMHLEQHIDNKKSVDNNCEELLKGLEQMAAQAEGKTTYTEEEAHDLFRSLQELHFAVKTLREFVASKL